MENNLDLLNEDFGANSFFINRWYLGFQLWRTYLIFLYLLQCIMKFFFTPFNFAKICLFESVYVEKSKK